MIYKEIIGIIAVCITIAAYVPYIYSIHKGKTTAHVFSWVIWGSSTLIVGIAQFLERGGAGSWPITISGIITLYVALLAYIKKGEIKITKTDWMFFTIAMLSIPLWYVTASPLWSVLLLTTIDLLGYAPTMRKAYDDPFKEKLGFFAIMAFRNFLSIAALEHYSLTTVFFPFATGVGSAILVGIIIYRRKSLKND